MTKVKLNQNTRMACSRSSPSSLPASPARRRDRFGGLLGAAGESRREGAHEGQPHEQLLLRVETSAGYNFH